MSNLTRRDFLKGSAALGVGFVSVGGILVPRNSEAASPAIGIILTSLIQVFSTFLSYYNQRKSLTFQEQFLPYDKPNTDYMSVGNMSGNITQNLLYTRNGNMPISNFQDTYDGNTLSLYKGSAYLDNGYEKGRYDPAELKIAGNYFKETGSSLIPKENTLTGYYNKPKTYQIDMIKERAKEDPTLSQFGELGEDYVIQGTRRFTDDTGKENLMTKFTTRDNPKILRTTYLA